MPVKSRTKNVTIPWMVRNFDESNTHLFDQNVEYEKPLLIETISYGNGRSKFQPCKHERRAYSYTGSNFAYMREGGSVHSTYLNYPGDYDFTEPARWDDLPVGFVGRSFQAMQPRLAAEISVPNFIFELKDVRSSLLSFHTSWQQLQARSVSSVSKAASGQHLNYSFGLAPLLSDIMTLRSAVSSFYDAFDKFVRDMGTVMTGHYHESVTLPSRNERISLGSYSDHRVQYDQCEVEYVATMKYRYRYGGPIPSRDSLLPAYYGFRRGNVASIAWNAMPMSFVADWVFRVGDVLDQMSGGALAVTVEVLDYCASMRYRRVSHYQVIDRPDQGGLNISPALAIVATATQSCYQRRPFSPQVAAESWVLPKIDGLSIRELLLSGSLLNMRR